MKGGTRGGKIAQLPHSLRVQVNLRLRDHLPLAKIAAWLKADHARALKKARVRGLRPDNISAWRRGGYRLWDEQQNSLDDMKLRQEFALDFARRSNGRFEQAALVMAASHICEILRKFDVRKLSKTLRKKPELYSLLVDAISKLSRASQGERKLQLESRRHRDHLAELKRKFDAEVGKGKRGFTAERMAEIQAALALL